jgi:hypothetical protein
MLLHGRLGHILFMLVTHLPTTMYERILGLGAAHMSVMLTGGALHTTLLATGSMGSQLLAAGDTE